MPKIQNSNAEILGEPDLEDWLICPNCGIKFKLSDRTRWKKRRHTTCGQLIKFTNWNDNLKPIWCVVANIAEDIPFGEEHQVQKGTKHFSSGTKVFCYPLLWGDGYENIKVIARHRSSKQFITMVIRSKWLVNCRAKVVYNPHIISEMCDVWDDSDKSKQTAENLAKLVNDNYS
jgi:hypothetical protein